ncbi:GIY-YIG nuclease family protein [Candidatus Berkelbacteria bacterium]|nr:GIY-YIG nuclease family protein [Candidatus Berkelbacteria bacterium]MBI2588281.1 GIY-YIG nuclease family protein [Candidatus Berkelbacteria bacterium]MBI4029714.1 GIY-YIG nuclease family protein [Candidatus Berkelbacteria bacterium]
MKAYLYIIQSLKNGTYYVGSTLNYEERFKQHNWGQVKSTRNKRPYKLVFYQEFPDIDMARKAERRIKKWKRKDFIEKIIKDGAIRGPVAQW